MPEMWYVAHIYLKPETYSQRHRVVLEAIRPIIEKLRADHLIENFHFLFEQDYEVLFRIRLAHTINDKETARAKQLVTEGLESVKPLCKDIQYQEDYPGERDAYGEEGWGLAQEFMDVGSRVAILTREVQLGAKQPRYGKIDGLGEFNPEKLVHLFLNQQGYDVLSESKFHSDRMIERWMIGYGILGRLDALEKEIESSKRERRQSAT